ncbi:dITP/XTP pyrophosphatase [Salinisphaera sp. PC39]|uniref:RdgB/HAM1 family non-canonical purine NTP pyrophosphatase n=1 Tax=Salinisphaera sp. PC39 TaxID=1304156 RepID=UPI00333E48EF
MNKIILASGNRGKLEELRAMLAELGIEVLSQGDFDIPGAEETGATFVENALLKAFHAAAHAGLPAIADDSGLCVDALDGAPGIHSARYAGDGGDAANNAKLLDALAGLPEERRGSHFHSTVVFVRHAADPAPMVCQGDWHGRVLTAPRGEGGFGYDPLFWVPAENASAAELPPGRKNAISHRGQAMQALLMRLTQIRRLTTEAQSTQSMKSC